MRVLVTCLVILFQIHLLLNTSPCFASALQEQSKVNKEEDDSIRITAVSKRGFGGGGFRGSGGGVKGGGGGVRGSGYSPRRGRSNVPLYGGAATGAIIGAAAARHHHSSESPHNRSASPVASLPFSPPLFLLLVGVFLADF